jgi:hypothetical protein
MIADVVVLTLLTLMTTSTRFDRFGFALLILETQYPVDRIGRLVRIDFELFRNLVGMKSLWLTYEQFVAATIQCQARLDDKTTVIHFDFEPTNYSPAGDRAIDQPPLLVEVLLLRSEVASAQHLAVEIVVSFEVLDFTHVALT